MRSNCSQTKLSRFSRFLSSSVNNLIREYLGKCYVTVKQWTPNEREQCPLFYCCLCSSIGANTTDALLRLVYHSASLMCEEFNNVDSFLLCSQAAR